MHPDLNKNLFASLLVMGTVLLSAEAEAVVIECQPPNLVPVPCAANSAGTLVTNGVFTGTVVSSGTVAVSNFPTSTPVTGTVAVSNSITVVPSGTQTINGHTTIDAIGTTALTTTMPVSGTVAVTGTIATQGGTTTVNIGKVGTVDLTNILPVSGTITTIGTTALTDTIPVSGTVAVIQSGTQAVTIQNAPTVTLAGTSAVSGNVGIVPITSGGLSVKNHLVLNGITSVAVDASPGQLYGVEAFNNGTVLAYIKMYNAAQGSVTCGGTLTPVSTYMIPAPSSGGGGFISVNTGGIAYSTAITACITTGFANNDTVAPAASTYMINFLYK